MVEAESRKLLKDYGIKEEIVKKKCPRTWSDSLNGWVYYVDVGNLKPLTLGDYLYYFCSTTAIFLWSFTPLFIWFMR